MLSAQRAHGGLIEYGVCLTLTLTLSLTLSLTLTLTLILTLIRVLGTDIEYEVRLANYVINDTTAMIQQP